MSKRPSRLPPILSVRPIRDLINRINVAKEELASLKLNDAQKRYLTGWVEVEFVCAALTLEGLVVSRDVVSSIAAQPKPEVSDANESDILKLLTALRSIQQHVQQNGNQAQLSPALLASLSRKQDASSNVGTRHAQLVSTCAWFEAESFAELHPVEQASIVLLRLLELKPFEEGNTSTALVAAGLFTLRGSLPPIIIQTDMNSAYQQALSEGARMNTKPMVDLVADAIERTLRSMIDQVSP